MQTGVIGVLGIWSSQMYYVGLPKQSCWLMNKHGKTKVACIFGRSMWIWAKGEKDGWASG